MIFSSSCTAQRSWVVKLGSARQKQQRKRELKLSIFAKGGSAIKLDHSFNLGFDGNEDAREMADSKNVKKGQWTGGHDGVKELMEC